MLCDCCCRILEYLLQLQSADLRREVLPDAFQSQPDTSEQGYDESSESYDADNEHLSTTPLQLLQVNKHMFSLRMYMVAISMDHDLCHYA